MKGDGCTIESEGEGQVVVVEGVAAGEGERCAAGEGERRGRVTAAEDGVVPLLQGNVGEHHVAREWASGGRVTRQKRGGGRARAAR